MVRLKIITFLLVLGAFCNDAYGQFFFNFWGPPAPRRQTGPRKQEPEPPIGDHDPTGYIMVNIGFAKPLGGFGTSFGTNYGSYALGGLGTNISAGIPVAGTNIGVALMLGNYDNPYNLDGFTNNVAISNSLNDNYYSVYSDDYSNNVIMAGLYYTWPIKKLSFDARAMAGIMISNFPEVAYGADAIWLQNYPQPTQDFLWDYAPSYGTSFAYDFGIGLRYRLRRKLCVSLNADYLGSTATYSTLLTYTDDYGNQSASSVSGTIPVSLFTLSIGLGYTIK